MEKGVSANRNRRSEDRPVPVAIPLLSDDGVWCIEDSRDVAIAGDADLARPGVIDHKIVGYRVVGYAVTCDGERVRLTRASHVQRHRPRRIHDDLTVSLHGET